ncbi:YlmH/Sll1252 family protein [uncultured Tyzzerella sp.]|uniref:YlmH family RNA-binding protein n=1 Tax=uncultured Tyzzerella sp. TaxID=2321398 RepID=UPI0029437089|nr:YlmH/Sll1252 family protein [uncultured Tyzzerella sp.]
MVNKQNILNNIQNKEDKILFSKIIDQLNFCVKNYENTFTDFLPILKYLEINSILSKQYIEQNIHFFGGFEDAERVVVGFFPEYTEPDEKSFPINLLEITYNEKYSRELTHRDFLGAILGLGIERTKVGDIIIENNRAICFLKNEIIDYININLDKVGNTKVKTKVLELKEYNIKTPKMEEKNIIISSLRLDAVLSGAFNIARGRVSDYIKGEKAFVNFVIEATGSKNVKTGDIITLRGLGRIKILGVVGKTKKDRVVLNIAKYI